MLTSSAKEFKTITQRYFFSLKRLNSPRSLDWANLHKSLCLVIISDYILLAEEQQTLSYDPNISDFSSGCSLMCEMVINVNNSNKNDFITFAWIGFPCKLNL